MAVDVTTSIEVARPRDSVAAYAIDPSNATAWYKNIRSVDLVTDGPLEIGSKVAFTAQFLGRSLAYTYEIAELEPGRRMVMRTSDGPFSMETTYEFDDAGAAGTKVTLRNRGEPTGFSRLMGPFIARAMRRANHKDLQQLKTVIEASSSSL